MFVGDLTVKEIKNYDEDIFALIFSKNGFNEEIVSGQFFNLLPSSEDGLILRRPISVGWQDENSIVFFTKKVGKGTTYFSKLVAGDKVNVMGPLGNGFDPSKANGKRVLLIGGGIGVAPLIELGKHLKSNGASKISYSIGFNNNPYGMEELATITDDVAIYSKENRNYKDGFPTSDLDERLKSGEIDIIYTCGPDLMMDSIVKTVVDGGYSTEVVVSLEERMGCGFGVCLCCSKIVKPKDSPFEKTVCVCKEGPIFSGRMVYGYE
jgi:dihydroorotate dehydrogenase electron transfer subunit